jgi:rod shape-determining protein MreD
MRNLVAIPVLGILIMLQSAVFSRIALLHGTADLLLLAVAAWALQEQVRTAWLWGLVAGVLFSIASSLPLGFMPAGYFLTIGVALLLKRRVWQAPILAMFIATFLGTLITQGFSIIGILTSGTVLPLLEALNLITLPSLLLNLLLALPMYILMADLAGWLHPKEMEV